ncbi:bifunctional 5,10-methylenetetrahydrofolate dehydrogenase/5,10-methenyltetrahydrofolate cyclohydrolase [Paenibacillus spongiae]|uniref:Bifunctional protein FolD n=1 Tax=Paenibacillus spongiae TaxID=2909671 RepID=A0ABY5S8X5_9BACL|nr:bifunctional 5,10-methylenetetrahydrofolate dehydrogenase/5,10-methenyltetrahydrofolate cyclohydrolase [Paenibacillus spongiae]UVI28980.1 bifunctional 5,10-methylenetetrahydrofolate dehydrogenase/5,10-methenyltetrahydrofolate cyclohydrolase [Paenibacillus spongiae]
MAVLLKAKPLADETSARIAAKVKRWHAQGVEPAIAAILVEGDPASLYYAQAKRRLAEKLNVKFELLTFPPDVQEEPLIQTIASLNKKADVHGIMLELPLPGGIRLGRLADAIDPLKDVDGIASANKLACMIGSPGIYPATPQSCIRLLHYYQYPLRGKHVVVIGRGETVGRPLVQLLLRENATVTVCHSHTPDLSVHIRQADIIIAAAGHAGLIKKAMVHPELVVIDAGINAKIDGNGITGDVDPETANAVRAISPVPGGVGTLTTVLLFENVMRAMDLQEAEGRFSR